MRTSHYHILTLYYSDMAVVKWSCAKAHKLLWWLVSAQPSFQHRSTLMVEKKT